MSSIAIIDAPTADGRRLRLELDPVELRIDGIPSEKLGDDVLRDGGTRVLRFAAGTVVLPHRIGDDDRRPRWSPAGSDSVEILTRPERPASLWTPPGADTRPFPPRSVLGPGQDPS